MQRQELEVLERMMGNENANQMNFFSEMSEYQITAREFFSTVLLDSLYPVSYTHLDVYKRQH